MRNGTLPPRCSIVYLKLSESGQRIHDMRISIWFQRNHKLTYATTTVPTIPRYRCAKPVAKLVTLPDISSPHQKWNNSTTPPTFCPTMNPNKPISMIPSMIVMTPKIPNIFLKTELVDRREVNPTVLHHESQVE